MSAALEKARGAAAFGPREREIAGRTEFSAARFVRRPNERMWDERTAELKAFRSLLNDWDGDGSLAPGPDLADGALALAQSLRKQDQEAPDRVVVGVNGTIYFEWLTLEGYYEIEVHSPTAAEGRLVRNGSDQIEVTTFGPGG